MKNTLKRLVSFMLLMLFIASSHASDRYSFAASDKEALIGKKRPLDMNVSQKPVASSAQSIEENLDFLHRLMTVRDNNRMGRTGGKAAPSALLFVSFSMPEDLLLSMIDEAVTSHVPVVLKGLVEGDFKITLNAIARLQTKAKKRHQQFQGLSIDPVWFEQFDIQQVPALVVTESAPGCESHQQCPNRGFDVVYGNVHLKNALSLIAYQGHAGKARAKVLLESQRA